MLVLKALWIRETSSRGVLEQVGNSALANRRGVVRLHGSPFGRNHLDLLDAVIGRIEAGYPKHMVVVLNFNSSVV
jgi:hypothetical protein